MTSSTYLTRFFMTIKQVSKMLKLSMLLNNSVQNLYDTLASENNTLGNASLYFNFGYWRNSPQTIDQAGMELAKLLAEVAAVSNHDELLDVGFGFGDQDFYWMRTFSPQKIHGINISKKQAALAKSRAREQQLSDRICFEAGDATALDFPDKSFDVVLALECAFHFKTREKFLKEAYRVLRPGGRIALADVVTASKTSPRARFGQTIVSKFWQIPRENLYNIEEYSKVMNRVGFDNASVKSIWDDVIPPHVEFAKRRFNDADIKKRMNLIYRNTMKLSLALAPTTQNNIFDYVIANAKKPGI